MSLVIEDVRCTDCGGEVALFGVPDKVWEGLGLGDEWLCEGCFALRMGVAPEELDEEIRRRRRRFNLKKFNRYCGELVPGMRVLHCRVRGEAHSRMTNAQALKNPLVVIAELDEKKGAK